MHRPDSFCSAFETLNRICCKKKSLELASQGLHPDLITLYYLRQNGISRTAFPCAHQAGVLAPVPPTLHPFPVSQWLMVDFVPVTAAGPLPISTGFPFKLSRLTAYEIVYHSFFSSRGRSCQSFLEIS
jgi:hypothetical protein